MAQTYFKITAKYEKKISEEQIQKIQERYLFEVTDYSQAQILSVAYLEKQIYGEYDCDISKVKFDGIVLNKNLSENDEFYFYEVFHTIQNIDENGNEKFKVEKYLFQSESLEDCVEEANKYFEETVANDHWLSGVHETDYDNVLLWSFLKDLTNE